MTRKYLLQLLLVFLACVCLSACEASKVQPRAEDGSQDLSQWNFSRDGIVTLDGQWEFYWRQLLTPNDFHKPDPPQMTGHFQIPGRWDGKVIDGVEQSGDGYATFRLNVTKTSEDQLLAIRIIEEACAYTLWINGEEVAGNGVVGTSRETMRPQYLIQLEPFTADGGRLEVILQVSNFHHRKGGVWYPIEIGRHEDLLRSQYTAWALDLLIFGGLLVMGVYYLFIYMLRRSVLSALYFAIFCTLIAIRTVLTNTRFAVYLFPSFSWELLYTIELLTVTVTMPVMLMFICSLYPNESSRRVVRAIQVIGAVASLIAVICSVRVSSYIVVPYQVVLLYLYLYITYVLIRATMAGREGARTILFGMTLFYVTVLNDVLASHDFIYTPSIASLGMMALVLAESFALSQRFAKTFSSVEKLSSELEQLIKVEQYLRQNQRQLTEMLDTTGVSIIAVDEAGEIAFGNRGVSDLLGVEQEELSGYPLKRIFPGGTVPIELADSISSVMQDEGGAGPFAEIALVGPDGGRLMVDVELAVLDHEEENYAALLVRRERTNGEKGDRAVPALEVIEGLNRNRQRLQALEESLGDALPQRADDSTLLRESIVTIDSALEQVDALLQKDDGGDSKRKLAVELMNGSLDYWVNSCGKSKVELAQQSRLWKVYVDQDGGKRTQTLNRYLSLSTIPKQPRWNKITRTARFVLASCKGDSHERVRIETLLTKLLSL